MQDDSNNAIEKKRRLWTRWRDLLAEREKGTSLALFRIGCGLTVLGSLLNGLLHGAIPWIWLDRSDGGYRTLNPDSWLFELLGGVSPMTLWPMIGVALLSAITLILGFRARWSAFVLLQSYLALSTLNYHVNGCDDSLITNSLWLLVLANSSATLSLDCRRHHGRWTSDDTVAAWPRYLVIYQLVIVYCTTGIQKISIYWSYPGDYSSLYYILQEPSWQRFDMSWLANFYPLTQAATFVTWYWETAAPLLLLALYFRRTPEKRGWLRRFFNWINFRRLYVLVGVMLHLGVFVFMGLGPFTWITLSTYFCLYHPDEWRHLFKRAKRTPIARERAPHSWRQALVVLFVTLHVAAVTLPSIPSPPRSSTRELLDEADVEKEIASWTETLNRWNFDLTPDETKQLAWNVLSRYLKIRNAAIAPFEPYRRFCGVEQGWRMFTGPHMTPTRLRIDIQESGEWREIYAERSRNARWRGWQLDHEHIRTAITDMISNDNHKEWLEFAQWLAKRAEVDFPGATAVRLRVERITTPTPQQVRDNTRPASSFDEPTVVGLSTDVAPSP